MRETITGRASEAGANDTRPRPGNHHDGSSKHLELEQEVHMPNFEAWLESNQWLTGRDGPETRFAPAF